MKGTITNTKIKKKLLGGFYTLFTFAVTPYHVIFITAAKPTKATLFPSEHIILTTRFPAQTQS